MAHDSWGHAGGLENMDLVRSLVLFLATFSLEPWLSMHETVYVGLQQKVTALECNYKHF